MEKNVEENDLSQTLIDHGSSDDEHNCEHDGLANTVGEDFEELVAAFQERVVGFVQARISLLTTAGADHVAAFDDLKQLAEYMKANVIFLQDPKGGRYDDVYHDDAQTATFQISGTCWAHASARALRDWFQQQFEDKISMLNLFPFENNIQKTLVHLALGYAEVADDPAQRSGSTPASFALKVGPIVGALMMIFAVDDGMRDIGQGWVSDEGLVKLLRWSTTDVKNDIHAFADTYSTPLIQTTLSARHATVLHTKLEGLVFIGFDSNNPNLDWSEDRLNWRRIRPDSQQFSVNVDGAHAILSVYAPIDSTFESWSYLLSMWNVYKHQPAKFDHYFEMYGQSADRDDSTRQIARDCGVQEIQEYHNLGWNFNVPAVLNHALQSSSPTVHVVELLLSFGCDPLEMFDCPRIGASMNALQTWYVSNCRDGVLSDTADVQNITDILVQSAARSCKPALFRQRVWHGFIGSPSELLRLSDKFDLDVNLESEIGQGGLSFFHVLAQIDRDALHLKQYLAAGVDVNHTCSAMGRTALHYAVSHAKRVNVATLLEANADVTIRDMNDHTALDVAHQVLQAQPDNEDIKEIIQLLTGH